MKKITYILTAGILMVILATIGCKKDDGGGLTEEEEQAAALNGTWTATSVNDGTSERADYDGFTITFNKANMTYQTGQGPDLLPMPKSGDFAFGASVQTQLILSSGSTQQEVTYALTGTQLTMSFTYTGPGFDNVRTNSVEGDWVFTFTKQ